jgi:hypothetical protein
MFRIPLLRGHAPPPTLACFPMIWIAQSEKDTATRTLEKGLWDTADQFRANSGLKAQEYSGPILGLIFLRFAEVRFTAQRARLEKASASSLKSSSPITGTSSEPCGWPIQAALTVE